MFFKQFTWRQRLRRGLPSGHQWQDLSCNSQFCWLLWLASPLLHTVGGHLIEGSFPDAFLQEVDSIFHLKKYLVKSWRQMKSMRFDQQKYRFSLDDYRLIHLALRSLLKVWSVGFVLECSSCHWRHHHQAPHYRS